MSSSTKVVIATTKELYLPILNEVIQALNIHIRNEIKMASEKEGYISINHFLFSDSQKNKWTNGCMLKSHDARSFSIGFSMNDSHRSIFSCVSLLSDYEDIVGKCEKIVFSLGANEEGEKIMEIVIEAVKSFGEVYYTPNDNISDISLIKNEADQIIDTSGYYFF